MKIAVLFARADSIYHQIEGCDVWDATRDALLWPGGSPVVAHPPCRAWGRLAHFANPREGEKGLAIWAVAQVRRWGGVIEHPIASHLWREAGLPPCGQYDQHGGWTFAAPQQWWGHRAEKNTWFYIVGTKTLPPIPFTLEAATHVIQSRKRDSRPHVSKAERERTPPSLARWLVDLAGSTAVNPQEATK